MIVRRITHSMGFRYRLHEKSLPGCPDLVFSRYRKVIQVFGCFWHPHGQCCRSHTPKSQVEYWRPKLARNRERDEANIAKLEGLGWSVLVIRECQIKDQNAVALRIKSFLTDNLERHTLA
jgi:DNA mismatch endonuclease, patch repair protein